VGLDTDVCDPRFNGPERKIVFLVCLADILPVVKHPSELDGGEVSGEREAGPLRM
jgi:hypothetical protein